MKNAFIFLLTFLFLETQFVYAASLPSGENVVSGDISISSSQNSMTITQSSEQSIIEWTSFDIGAQNSVTFNQPSINASALNRVVSGLRQQQQSMRIPLLPPRLLYPMMIFSIINFYLKQMI